MYLFFISSDKIENVLQIYTNRAVRRYHSPSRWVSGWLWVLLFFSTEREGRGGGQKFELLDILEREYIVVQLIPVLQNNVEEPTGGEGSYILGHQPGFSHQPSCHVIISYRTHWSSSAPLSSPSKFKGIAESLWFCLWLLQSKCLVFCLWRNVGEISTEGSRRRWRLLDHAHYWPKCLVISCPYCPYCQASITFYIDFVHHNRLFVQRIHEQR